MRAKSPQKLAIVQQKRLARNPYRLHRHSVAFTNGFPRVVIVGRASDDSSDGVERPKNTREASAKMTDFAYTTATITEHVGSAADIGSKLDEPKTHKEAVNGPIHGLKWHEAVENELQYLLQYLDIHGRAVIPCTLEAIKAKTMIITQQWLPPRETGIADRQLGNGVQELEKKRRKIAIKTRRARQGH